MERAFRARGGEEDDNSFQVPQPNGSSRTTDCYSGECHGKSMRQVHIWYPRGVAFAHNIRDEPDSTHLPSCKRDVVIGCNLAIPCCASLSKHPHFSLQLPRVAKDDARALAQRRSDGSEGANHGDGEHG